MRILLSFFSAALALVLTACSSNDVVSPSSDGWYDYETFSIKSSEEEEETGIYIGVYKGIPIGAFVRETESPEDCLETIYKLHGQGFIPINGTDVSMEYFCMDRLALGVPATLRGKDYIVEQFSQEKIVEIGKLTIETAGFKERLEKYRSLSERGASAL